MGPSKNLGTSQFFGKKILFIGPRYFGYEKEILTTLLNWGALVDFLPDRPFQSTLLKAITRVRRSLVLPYTDRVFLASIELLSSSDYDFIFVVQGECVSKKVIERLRVVFPQAKLIWYLWDSLRNKPALARNLPLFHECFTFDKSDAALYGIHFRPLFFMSEFSRGAGILAKYDISFVGTAHSDRYRVLSNVKKHLPKSVTVYSYLFLQAPWMFWFNRITNSAFKDATQSDFSFTPLTRSEILKVFFRSSTILDIEHPNQTGLTMRTFEALGANKKLITTNRCVAETDFYRADNILIVDRKNPIIPLDFLYTPYSPLPKNIYSKYSIEHWLMDILDHKCTSDCSAIR